jgi:hypothetical protein
MLQGLPHGGLRRLRLLETGKHVGLLHGRRLRVRERPLNAAVFVLSCFL